MRAKANASRRTKNRVKEHNLQPRDRPVIIRLGVEHRLFRCVGHCEWLGWLPVQELDNG